MLDLPAYIDPGSGSLIVQAAIATLVALPFFFRQQIGRAVRTFRRGGSPEPHIAQDLPGVPAERDA